MSKWNKTQSSLKIAFWSISFEAPKSSIILRVRWIWRVCCPFNLIFLISINIQQIDFQINESHYISLTSIKNLIIRHERISQIVLGYYGLIICQIKVKSWICLILHHIRSVCALIPLDSIFEELLTPKWCLRDYLFNVLILVSLHDLSYLWRLSTYFTLELSDSN
jgi:hypothetical protein